MLDEPPVYGPPAPQTYDRALPVWQVEDRRTYWQTIKQMQEEFDRHQREAEALRLSAARQIRAEDYRTQEFQQNELNQYERPNDAAIRFGQGIMETIDPYRRAAVMNQFNTPELREVARRSVVYPAGPGEDSFYQPGFIQADPSTARHEATHGYYYEQMTPAQRTEFLQTVMALANSDPVAAQALKAGANTVGGTGVDPQHVYTFFTEIAPERVPSALKRFYPDMQRPDFAAGLQEALGRIQPSPELYGLTQSYMADRQRRGLGTYEPDTPALRAQEAAYGPVERVGLPPQRFGFTDIEDARRALNEESPLTDRGKRAKDFWTQRDQALSAFATQQTGDKLPFFAEPFVYEVPGAKYVQEKAGEAGRAVGEFTHIPGAGAAGEFIGEAIVPTQVWSVALEFVPGIGTVPGVISFGRKALAKMLELRGLPLTAKGVQQLVEQEGPEAVEGFIRQYQRQADPEFFQPVQTPRNALLRESEQGELVPARIPDEVKAIVTRKRGRGVPIRSDEELQAAWEVLPPSHQKMITAMTDAVITPAERKAALKAGRIRQVSGVREALEGGGSTVERALAARGAEKGRIIPAIRAIGEQFDGSEIDELYGAIDNAFANEIITPFEHPNATSALQLLLTGKRLPTDVDAPLNLMPHEIGLLGKIFGPEFEAALPRTPEQITLLQKMIDVANLPRAIVASFDVSAPGRQGIIVAARNPEKWIGSMGPMFRAWGSEKGYDTVIANIQKHRRFEEFVMRDVGLTDIGGGKLAEEPFASRLAHKIPIIRRSERAYSAYLNDLRASVADKGWSRLERTAQKHGWDEARLNEAKDQWAAFVRHATGRGDVSKLAEYTPAFNALFFSPRFVISRPQTVWDMVRPGADPAVRQMVGENLGAFFAGGVSLLGLAAAAGASVELDPRSTNFGKITFPLKGGGIQTIDFWGGFQPFARYAVQVATGKRKEQFTGELVGINRGETLGRFIRSKLSPLGALGWDVLVAGGKTFEGDELTLTPESIGNQALDRVTPLVLADMIEAYRTGGLREALVAGGVSVLGGGVSTFEPSENQAKEVEKSALDKRLDEAQFPRAAIAFKQDDWQRRFQQAFPGVDVSQYDTYEDLKQAAVDEWAPQLPSFETKGEAEARAEAGRQFDALPISEEFKAAEKAAVLQWMRTHRALAREAAKQGAFGELSKEEEEALGLD